MSALSHLEALLRPGTQVGAEAMRPCQDIDPMLSAMEKRSKARGTEKVSEDRQLEAVRRFWDRQEVPTFLDAYQLSWGLCIPHHAGGPCIMEDRPRFQRVLNGIGNWKTRPNAFRRCYQGLVKSYFTYDALADQGHPVGCQNWKHLRGYLQEHNRFISDKSVNPDWVATAVGNRQLFGEDPCRPYVDALLSGDEAAINHLCQQLGISQTSWFLRELIMAQVRAALKLGKAQFESLIPRLLALIGGNNVLRDRGLILVLDHYAEVSGTVLNQHLRDASVLWWGNPWLPSKQTNWGGVKKEARAMVSEWLKLEFIETFFRKLADDGMGEPRRMEFWKRYVKSIGHIEFALGQSARRSRQSDFVVLRKKMEGLICELDAPGTNNAFIMTMGDVVLVEFSGMGNALYGYDARKKLPFDIAEPLQLGGHHPNSLKNKAANNLWMQHQDGIHGHSTWESMFELTLRRTFGITPDVQAPRVSRAPQPPAAPPHPINQAPPGAAPIVQPRHAAVNAPEPYSRIALDRFANAQGLRIDDKTSRGGSLWVLAGSTNTLVTKVLTGWGFRHKPDKGWWK